MRLLSTICLLILCTFRSISCDDILVQVQQGKLRGSLVTAVPGDSQYYSFKGIPYAKPPVGKLRFMAPQEPESWDGVRNATEHGSVCPQVNQITNVYTTGSEDCLFLNVYTPKLKSDTLLPVIFFVSASGFKFGSGDEDFFGPDFLVSKDVIVVTSNHRLDTLGFLTLGTKEVPGNAGLKDQVAALKWVHKNIENFGGSPNNVTIFGHSSGAVSVSYHLVSPMSKGLFQRAIISSGVPSCDAIHQFEPVRRAFVLGKTLGLETKNASELLNYLQRVSYDKLINQSCPVMTSEVLANILYKGMPFAAVVEEDLGQERFVIEDPFVSLNSGNVNNVDVMFSHTNQETAILIPIYVQMYIDRYNKYPELFVPTEMLVNLPSRTILEISDKIIDFYFGNKTVSVDNIVDFVNYGNVGNVIYDTHRFFRKWPKVGSLYSYIFSCYSSRNYFGQKGAKYGIEGASHYDDMGYVFDPKSMNQTLDMNSTEYMMVQRITTAITNFAKYGNPSPNSMLGVTWPQFDNESLAYVEFGEELSVGYKSYEKDVQFWRGLFEDYGMPF